MHDLPVAKEFDNVIQCSFSILLNRPIRHLSLQWCTSKEGEKVQIDWGFVNSICAHEPAETSPCKELMHVSLERAASRIAKHAIQTIWD